MTTPTHQDIDDIRQQARDTHMAGDTVAAIALLTQAMQLEPSNINVAMDMTQIFIDLNEFEQAKGLFNQLPDESKDSVMGKSLMGQLTFLELATKTQGKAKMQKLLVTDPNNCDAHFDLAICLVAERGYSDAVEHLFKIISIEPDYKETAAREMIINVAKMLEPNNPTLSSEIHRKLSSITWA